MATIETDWLGDVPAPAPNVGGRPAKGYGARSNRKLTCLCGFSVRTSAAQIERHGYPTCACGERMTLANFRDRIVVNWRAAQDELASAPPEAAKAMRAELRRLGYADESRAPRERRSGAQQRCRWQGGYCSRFASSSGYCHEHNPHEYAARGHTVTQ